MPSFTKNLSLAASLALARLVDAGFSTSSSTMISMYWGQNSFGQSSGDLEQQDLAFYCASKPTSRHTVDKLNLL